MTSSRADLKMKEQPNDAHRFRNYVKRNRYLLTLLACVVTVSLLAYLPYLRWESLVGWDTPIYMYNVLYIERYGIASAFTSGVLDKPLFALILYALSSVINPERVLKLTPLIFSSIYVVSTYLLYQESAQEHTSPLLVALFSSTAFATLRLANENQPYLLALSCLMISVYFYLRYTQRGGLRNLLLSMIGASFLLGIHPLAYCIYIPILVFSLLATKGRAHNLKREITGVITSSLPVITVMLILLFTSMTPVVTLVESLFNPRVISAWISYRKWSYDLMLSTPLLILAAVGTVVLLRSGKSVSGRIQLTWMLFASVLFVIFASIGAVFANRFILTLPLPIFAAYSYKVWPKKQRNRHLILGAVILANLCIAAYYQMSVEPWISKELKDELIWVRDNLGDKLIVPIAPFGPASNGYWVLGIVGDYIYYGEILPLLTSRPEQYQGYPTLDTSVNWERLESDGVLAELSNYRIVLLEGLYKLSAFDMQLVQKLDGHNVYLVEQSIIDNTTQIEYYYQAWREFKDLKIAVIGEDWEAAKSILYDLWISPVPTGFVDHPNVDYLGTGDLPTPNDSNEYDLLILADWDAQYNKTNVETTMEYFSSGCSIIATSESAYKLGNISSRIVEDIFGTANVYPADRDYSNVTYHGEHYVTANLTIPFSSTDPDHGVPAANLTTAQGVAKPASTEELYLITVNQRGGARAAHFGLFLSEIGENDTAVFRRLIMWTLNLEGIWP